MSTLLFMVATTVAGLAIHIWIYTRKTKDDDDGKPH
jgi:hypothetical protein